MENVSLQFVDRIYEMSQTYYTTCIKDKERKCSIDYLVVVIGGSKANRDINEQLL